MCSFNWGCIALNSNLMVTERSNFLWVTSHEILSEPPRYWCGAGDANGRCEDKCHD